MVEVKKLVWEPWIYGDAMAPSAFGHYHVWDGYWRAPGETGGKLADDPKSAAQADYTARILAAIQPAPDTMAQVREALTKADNIARDLGWHRIYDETSRALALLTKEG